MSMEENSTRGLLVVGSLESVECTVEQCCLVCEVITASGSAVSSNRSLPGGL